MSDCSVRQQQPSLIIQVEYHVFDSSHLDPIFVYSDIDWQAKLDAGLTV